MTIEAGKEYCAAFTADPDYGYQLFLNGEMVLDLPLSELTASSGYGFMADIPGIDTRIPWHGRAGRRPPGSQQPLNIRSQEPFIMSKYLTACSLRNT